MDWGLWLLWLLVVGCWFLVLGSWLFVVGCLLFVVVVVVVVFCVLSLGFRDSGKTCVCFFLHFLLETMFLELFFPIFFDKPMQTIEKHMSFLEKKQTCCKGVPGVMWCGKI